MINVVTPIIKSTQFHNVSLVKAISYQSMELALFGRLLVGIGSAEVINRQLISACVSYHHMTRASAMFVSVSAIGMSIGPLIAAILDMTGGRDIDVDIRFPLPGANYSGGIVLDHCTDPGKEKQENKLSLLVYVLIFPLSFDFFIVGFLMALLWLIQLISLVFFFTEPERINCMVEGESNTKMQRNSDSIWTSFVSIPRALFGLFSILSSNQAFVVSSYFHLNNLHKINCSS